MDYSTAGQKVILALAFLVCVSADASAGPAASAVEGVKQGAGYIGKTVGSTVGAVGDKVGGIADRVTGDVDPKAKRKEIDRATEQGLKRLFDLNPKAKSLFDQSYGYAVFNSGKSSFFISLGTGEGEAVSKADTKRTYMRMFTAGANLGAGVQFVQTIFLFETKRAFESFVNSGWEAGTSANANFGQNTADAQLRFTNGMAIFQIADTGINLSVDLTGTKYWKDKELN